MSSGNGTIFPTPAQSAAQLKIEAATAETAATKRHATFVAEPEASNQALSSHLRPECHAAITKTRITGRAAELILAGMILAA